MSLRELVVPEKWRVAEMVSVFCTSFLQSYLVKFPSATRFCTVVIRQSRKLGSSAVQKSSLETAITRFRMKFIYNVFLFARVLLERLIVNRPHPWGLLITFIELIKV
jgi:CCR4-Not complex component, Not1